MTKQPPSPSHAAIGGAAHPAFSWWKVALLSFLIALLVLFAFGLRRDSTFISLALVGRTLPGF